MDRPEVRKTETPDVDSSEVVSAVNDDWVHELIAMTRPGIEIRFPLRGLGDRVIPFQYDDFS